MPGTFAYTESTNIVVVTGGTSGSPADFASFVAADRAGTGTSLLAATSPGSSVTLTYPELMPGMPPRPKALTFQPGMAVTPPLNAGAPSPISTALTMRRVVARYGLTARLP